MFSAGTQLVRPVSQVKSRAIAACCDTDTDTHCNYSRGEMCLTRQEKKNCTDIKDNEMLQQIDALFYSSTLKLLNGVFFFTKFYI